MRADFNHYLEGYCRECLGPYYIPEKPHVLIATLNDREAFCEMHGRLIKEKDFIERTRVVETCYGLVSKTKQVKVYFYKKP